MSIQDQLDRLRGDLRRTAPPGVLDVADKTIQFVANTGLTESAVREGDRAPDFDLPGVDGESVSLSAKLAKGPVILSFFRGGWCPFCSLELRAYESLVSKIRDEQSSLLSVSPETLESLRQTAQESEVSFPLLSDATNATARAYGLVYRIPEALRAVYEGLGLDLPARNGDVSFELPVPATYLIDSEGVVRRAFIEPDWTQRGEPADFVESLKDLH
jgi:peroxiredoxin